MYKNRRDRNERVAKSQFFFPFCFGAVSIYAGRFRTHANMLLAAKLQLTLTLVAVGLVGNMHGTAVRGEATVSS